MIVLVFDPLAVLLLIAANWNMKHHQDDHWTDFFKKEKSEDFPEKKEIIEDVKENPVKTDPIEDIPVLENEETWAQRVIDEEPMLTQKEHRELTELVNDSEIPEIEIEEPTKDWAPELYNIPRGDVMFNSQYPDDTNMPPKTASFMRKMADFLRPSNKTIEQEVKELQDPKNS